MNIKTFKIFLTIITFILLLVLALPEFTFNLNGQTYRYPSVGFSRIGIGADYGSLTQGKDVYASEVFTANVDFGEEEISSEDKRDFLTKAVNTIDSRIKFAEIYDITVQGEITNDEYKLNLIIPNNYPEREVYADWLFSRGEIEFRYLVDPNNPESEIDFEVSEEDIKTIRYASNISFQQNVDDGAGGSQTQRSSVSGSNLVISVDDRRIDSVRRLPNFVSYFNRFFSGEEIGANMIIDGEKILHIIRDDINESTMRALLVESSDPRSNYNILNIVHSLFTEDEALAYSINLVEETKVEAPVFNPEGTTLIAGSIIVGLGLLVLNVGKSLKARKTILFISGISFGLLTLTNILKFVQTPISSGFIIGIITVIAIFTFVIFDLLKTEDKTDLTQKNFDFVVLGLISILSLISIYVFNVDLGMFTQTLEVIVAGFISLVITIFFHLNFIINTFLIENQTIRSIFGLRKSYE